MEAKLAALREKNKELNVRVKTSEKQIRELEKQNVFLQRKNAYLIAQLFGRKSEKLDPNQPELLPGFEIPEAAETEDENPLPVLTRSRRKRRDRTPQLPEDIPTEEIFLDPEEVRANPESFVCIGEEITRELDVIPAAYILKLLIRRKFVRKIERNLAPIIAPLPPRLIPCSIASASLVCDIVLKKYQDHLPLYRQERILRERHRIELSRKTMSDWVRVVAEWLKPIYNHLAEELRLSGYLQVDETPVRYANAEGGGSGLGYLWVYHHPGSDVLYEWHTGRGADCLEKMLGGFAGTVQSDGYSAYKSYARGREQIVLCGCWAHARRKFFEALDEEPGFAGWILNQIGHLYRIESRLRRGNAGARLRDAVRGAHSRMILERIEKSLRLKLSRFLPQSQMGKAVAYTLRHWKQLVRYSENGILEIDNNLVENAIRPTCLGKKNWLFIGHPEAGERSAIIYTLLESCKRHRINPQEYLRDVLSRLPAMKMKQTKELTPANWAKAENQQQAA